MPSDSPPVDAIRIRSSEKGWRDRLTVAGRVALAAFGGYAVAGLVSALGAMTLPLSRAEAVSASMLASFAVMAGIVIFVFAAASLRRAALTIAAAVILLTAALWLSGGFSATVTA
ncbi:iron transporter [Methylobacterium komagatae]|uniref:Iron transporter n=1 Tax=Methylobacterium komagatae TaxID=374425 RepID=A0ABW2BRD5_9HYPH